MQIARYFLCVLFLGLALQALGSSHSEAPGTAKKPSSDITDFYMFRSYEDPTKLILAMGILGLQSPNAGPNYYTISDQHFFEFHLSCNNANTVSRHVFQFYFGSALGGPTGPAEDYDDYDLDCDFGTPVFPGTVNTGVTLPIGTPNAQNVGIALKVFGGIDSPSSPINWFDYYYMNYIPNWAFDQPMPSGTAIGPSSGGNQFRIPFANIGDKTFTSNADYESYARQFIYQTSAIPYADSRCPSTGARVFVGPRAEPFSIDLGRTFDLINYVPTPQGTANCYENWDIKKNNVHYIVLEVPINCVRCANDNPVLAGWTAVRELMHSGSATHIPGQQTNRFGNPLVNELLIALREKSLWNAEHPNGDAQFTVYFRYPTFPAIVQLLFNVPAPTVFSANNGRADIDTVLNYGIPGLNQPTGVFPCDMMRLNVDTPVSTGDEDTDFNNYGVLAGDAAGFPNGRRFFDDVVDIVLQVAMGALCRDEFAAFNFCANPDVDAPARAVLFRDGSPIQKSDFDNTFPFLRTPTPGSVQRDHPRECSSAAFTSFSLVILALLAVIAMLF